MELDASEALIAAELAADAVVPKLGRVLTRDGESQETRPGARAFHKERERDHAGRARIKPRSASRVCIQYPLHRGGASTARTKCRSTEPISEDLGGFAVGRVVLRHLCSGDTLRLSA